MTRIILASKSPRRAELLSRMGYAFEVCDAKIDESAILAGIMTRYLGMGASNMGGLNGNLGSPTAPLVPSIPLMYLIAEETVRVLSQAKASAVYEPLVASGSNQDIVVIGSDTVVVSAQQILGKPVDAEDAKEMLITLSGQTHRVYTGVTVLAQGATETFVSYADVTFHALDEIQMALIEKYVAGGSPMDKAGAYGIQDEGALLIDAISGDYYAVVGLPISPLYHVLTKYVQ